MGDGVRAGVPHAGPPECRRRSAAIHTPRPNAADTREGAAPAAAAAGAAIVAAPEPQDRWIRHPDGRIFSRRWWPSPRAAAAASGDASPSEPVDGLAPILLWHDSLGCVAVWRDFPAALAEATGRSVIAYDRLGFGRSDARIQAPSLQFVAEEAAEVLPLLREQLGLERFVAMGHSVGGGMAIEAAARSGPACEALVTLAAQVHAEDRTLRGIRAAQRQFEDAAQVQRLQRYHGDKARWVLDAWIGRWLHPDFAAWRLEPVLARVRCPVLAVHGEMDEYGSTFHPETIGRCSAGPAEVEVMAGIGHMPHREAPERTLARIARFLSRPMADRPSAPAGAPDPAG